MEEDNWVVRTGKASDGASGGASGGGGGGGGAGAGDPLSLAALGAQGRSLRVVLVARRNLAARPFPAGAGAADRRATGDDRRPTCAPRRSR